MISVFCWYLLVNCTLKLYLKVLWQWLLGVKKWEALGAFPTELAPAWQKPMSSASFGQHSC